MPATAAIRLVGVTVVRDGRAVLCGIDWMVERSQRWMILGPNGSGKTTLVQLATGHLHPSAGTVDILGRRLGRVDVRQLRKRIGLVSGAVTRLLRPQLTAAEVVMTGLHAALEPCWHVYDDDDRARALALLASAGLDAAADRPFGVLSEGERQQVLLARALMAEPELLVLDEPAAGLDLGAREHLITRLEAVAADPAAPPAVFVTHHVEEIPYGFDHVLMLRDGRVVAQGPMESTLTGANLGATFGLALTLGRTNNRYQATAL